MNNKMNNKMIRKINIKINAHIWGFHLFQRKRRINTNKYNTISWHQQLFQEKQWISKIWPPYLRMPTNVPTIWINETFSIQIWISCHTSICWAEAFEISCKYPLRVKLSSLMKAIIFVNKLRKQLAFNLICNYCKMLKKRWSTCKIITM